MNVKQAIKKMSAVLAGATMLGATVMGAMAYDLSDYPHPFVKDGVFGGKIVVGATAKTSDVLGAVDIGASLQAASKTPVSTGGGVVTVSGGKVEDVLVGTGMDASTAFGSTVDYTDVPFLSDSSVDIDIGDTSGTYDFHEEIRFNSGASSFGLNLTTGLAYDGSDDYKDDVFVTAGKGTLGYYFVFDENLDSGNYLSDATSSDPVELEFMGRVLRVTDASEQSLTVDIANEYYLTVGSSVNVDGKKVVLMDVASSGSTVVVSVDGVTDTVANSGRVNGLRISVRSTFTSDTKADRSASLLIGDKTTDSFSDGEEYIGEDKNDPQWVWVLDGLNTSTPTIGVKWNADLDKASGEDYADYSSVIYEGESISFPQGFAKLTFDSLTQTSYSDYSFDTDTRDLYGLVNGTSVEVLRVRSDKSNSGLLTNGVKSDTIYLRPFNDSVVAVFYKDSSNSRATFSEFVASGSTAFTVDYSKSSQAFVASGNFSTKFNLTATDGSDILKIAVSPGSQTADYLGLTDDDTDTGLWYNGASIAGHEEDLLMLNGVRISDPDSQFQKTSGTLTLSYPADISDFRANMVLSGTGSSVSQEDTGAYEVNAFTAGAAVLDTDAEALIGSTPLISVGGPFVNTVTAQLMGNPTTEQINSMFKSGLAKIKLFESQNALVVAGYTAQDTLGAAYVLADYMDYSLSGSEVEVVVPSLNSLSVREPTLPAEEVPAEE